MSKNNTRYRLSALHTFELYFGSCYEDRGINRKLNRTSKMYKASNLSLKRTIKLNGFIYCLYYMFCNLHGNVVERNLKFVPL